jgi:hypothetical protein
LKARPTTRSSNAERLDQSSAPASVPSKKPAPDLSMRAAPTRASATGPAESARTRELLGAPCLLVRSR